MAITLAFQSTFTALAGSDGGLSDSSSAESLPWGVAANDEAYARNPNLVPLEEHKKWLAERQAAFDKLVAEREKRLQERREVLGEVTFNRLRTAEGITFIFCFVLIMFSCDCNNIRPSK